MIYLKRLIFTVIILLSVLELSAALSYFYEAREFLSPQAMARHSLRAVWDNPGVRRCPEHAAWGPMPYIGHGRDWNSQKKCGTDVALANNRGMPGPAYPEEREAKFFTILLTGGSGAERLGLLQSQGKYYLEAELNRRLLAPDGKTFRILVAANGDYRQPQQLITLMLYHDIIDGVIDLSGYNEVRLMNGRNRPEKASDLYWGLFQSGQQASLRTQIRRRVSELEAGACRFSYVCLRWVEFRIQRHLSEFHQARTYHEQRNYELFPADLPLERLARIRLAKLHGYYRLMKASCAELGLRCSFFIQPILDLKRKLNKDERQIYPEGREDFARLYQTFIKSMPKEVHSLTGIFDHTAQAAFSDSVHLISEDDGKVSWAYAIEARAMIEQVSKDWGLKVRPSGPQ